MRWITGRRTTTPEPSASADDGADRGDLPLVSVVVPVYNVELYLLEAVSSIQEQTYRHLEIILVDDGSTDDSGRLCDEIAAEDSRVRVIHQANQGLSGARNAGLAAATGDFIAFADSDDLVHRTAYERMVASLTQTGSDFVTGNVRRFNSTRDWQAWNQQESHGRRRERTTLHENPELVYDTVAWNKLFRREFVERIGLEFPVGRLYEDMVPMSRAYVLAESVDVLQHPVYSWREREEGGSITQRRNELANMRAKLEAVAEMHEVVQAEPGSRLAEHLYLKLFHGDLWVFSRELAGADEEYCAALTDAVRTYWTAAPEELRAKVKDENRLFFSCTVAHGARAAAEASAWFLATSSERHTVIEHDQVLIDDDHYPSRLPRLPEEARVLRSGTTVKHRLTAMAWRGDVLEVEGWAYVPSTIDAEEQVLEVSARHRKSGERLVLPHRRRQDPAIDVLAQDTLRTYAGAAFTARLDLTDPDLRDRLGRGAWVLEATVRAADLVRTAELVDQDRTTTLRTVSAHELSDGTVVTPVVEARQAAHLTVEHPPVRATRVRLDRRRLVVDLAVDDRHAVVGAWLDHEHLSERAEATVSRRRRKGVRVVLDVPQPVTRGDLLRTLRVRTRAGRALPVHLPETLVPAPTDRVVSVRRSRRGTLQIDDAARSIVIRHLEIDSSTRVRLSGTAPGPQLELAVHAATDGPRTWVPVEVDESAGTFSTALDLSFTDVHGRRRPRPSGRYSVTLRDPDSLEPWALRTATEVIETFPLVTRDADAQVTVRSTVTGRLNLQLDPPVPPEERSLFARRRLRAAFGEHVEVEPEDAVFFCVDLGSNACDSALAIHRELVRRGSDMTLYWGVDDHSVQVPPEAVPIAKHGRLWFEKLARSRYLVNNYGGIDGSARRPHQRYLQTWHGTPYKLIGRSQMEHQGASAEEAVVRRREGAQWDGLISPSPYFSELAPREFFYDGPILETGYPRNDVLVDASDDEKLAVRARLGVPETAKVLLYAPTFRDLAAEGWSASMFSGLDLQRLSEHLGEDWVVLLRGHSFNARHDVRDRSRGRVVDATHHHDINDLYLAADALVTDYSSAMFDFCVTGKPILYFVPDVEQYVRARGVYFDLESIAPGPWCATQGELHDALDTLDAGAAELRDRYAAFRERFAPWDDGRAASRVVDVFFGGD